jgi:rod shape-determining protein MreD
VRRALGLLLLGLLGLWLQSALATRWGAHWIPDLSLLFPAAAALWLGPLEGLLVAAALGLATDTLSGSLLGQHALLRLLEFAALRAIASQLDLRRSSPLVFFAFALSLADAAGMAALTRLFLGPLALSTGEVGALVGRAAITALAAPFVIQAARRWVERLGESEAPREMRLDTRRPAL